MLFALWCGPDHEPPPPPPVVSCYEEAGRDKRSLNECKARWRAAAERTSWRGIARFWTWVKSVESGREP